MKENIKIKVNKKPETIETVRERERELQFIKIGFICYAKNKLNRHIKRIGYKRKNVQMKKTQKNSLSFLCAQKTMRIKDKYA